ncbi:MAG: hypothetical protein OXB93_02900 [Cytophagales bacterium]|nr:hypothetical protein [Cytophagales bacterium]
MIRDLKCAYWLFHRLRCHKLRGNHLSFTRIIRALARVNVCLGVLGVLLSLSILKGFESNISSRLHNFLGQIQIESFSLSREIKPYFEFSKDSLDQEGIHTEGVAYAPVLFKGTDQSYSMVGMGMENFSYRNEYLYAGRLPKKGERTCALSQKVARQYKLNIGDTLVFHFLQNPPRYRKLKLVGLYQTQLLEDIDNIFLWIPISLLRKLHNKSNKEVMGLHVFLDPDLPIPEAINILNHKLPPNLYATPTSEKYVHLFDWLRLIRRNAHIFIILILSVAAFNMLSLLFILMMDRIRMVGVLRALGAPAPLLGGLFVYHGLFLILQGMFWGNILSLAFVLIQSSFHLIQLNPETYLLSYVPTFFSVSMWLKFNLLLFFILCLPLLLPMIQMIRKGPVQLLRFR